YVGNHEYGTSVGIINNITQRHIRLCFGLTSARQYQPDLISGQPLKAAQRPLARHLSYCKRLVLISNPPSRSVSVQKRPCIMMHAKTLPRSSDQNLARRPHLCLTSIGAESET